MNNKFLIILFVFFSITSFSQKCYYEKDKIDEKTNFIIRRTTPTTICKVNGHPFSIKTQQIGDRRYLKLRYYRNNTFSITEGSSLILYFQNNQKLILEPLAVKKKSSDEQSGFSTVSRLIIFQLSKDEINQLLNNPVIMIGFYTNKGIAKNEIKPKLQNSFQKLLKCIQ